ncbi:Pectinesterase [Phytophthora palmivora]|uniref:Pectinesterase n=1 Tax=Phytophthora palmivora TaxID=4796 RepID=A0A2P4YFW3_9STRA|nr:Pectinesterase [Phytophthora palmivora]
MKAFVPVVVFASVAIGLVNGAVVDDSDSASESFAPETCSGPNARIEPPAGAIVVDATGDYDGSYVSMSEGVKTLDVTTSDAQTIFVMPGIYEEQVFIPKLSGALLIQGSTCDATSYVDNEVTITQATAQKDLPREVTKGRNDLTSTMRFKPNNVKVYNINIANTAGNVGQAVAATVDGTGYGFYGCNFTGYQDTLYANKGRQLYAKSYISGAVDFVFGSTATAWFEDCDIETIGKGCITANGRNSEENPSYYVFNNARVFGSNPAGSSYLGRPWRPFARVVWQNSELSDVINPLGWSAWDATSSTNDVHFREFKNTGAGAPTDERVEFSLELKKAVDITEILGEDYESEWWVDTDYL